MIFNIKKRICFCHTDAGGIVYHSKYLDFCEEARLEYFLKHGLTQKYLAEKYHMMFVLKSCEINYKQPAKAEDLLTIGIENSIVNKLLIEVHQNIYRGDSLLVECKINLVVIDTETLHPLRKLPDEVLKLVQQGENKN